MQVEVGTTVVMKGRRYICTEISEEHTTKVAEWESELLRASLSTIGNHKFAILEIGQFERGDIVIMDHQVVTFVAPGEDIQYFSTWYKIKRKEREGGNNTTGAQEDTHDPAAQAA